MKHEERFDFIETEEQTNQKALDDMKYHRRRVKQIDIWENIPGWRYVNLQKKYTNNDNTRRRI